MKQVLIIEDEAFLRESIQVLLETEGFSVLCAGSGEEGVAVARERLPDLIIADVLMPGLDGYGVLEALRSTSDTAAAPFIFLTAKKSRADMRRGMELGAADYITKPFRTPELLAAVRAQFEKQAALESARLRSLSHYLVEAQEAERSRVAHELHDNVSQLLSGLKITLGMGQRLPPDALHAVLSEAQETVDAILQRIKQLSRDLRPAILDVMGLLPALEQFLDQQAPSRRVRLSHAGLDRRFPAELETVAYRIVQKTLTEIMAGPAFDAAAVRVWTEADALCVEISDEHGGFDLNAALNVNPASAFVELYERVGLVGGQLTIESSPNARTRVRARLPLENATLRRAPTSAAFSGGDSRPEAHAASSGDDGALRVALADAHDLMRRGVHALLKTVPGVMVVYETACPAELATVERLNADVVLLDPGAAPGDVIPAVLEHAPNVRILVLSMHAEPAYAAEALRSGATGYALKDSSADELLEAVRQTAAGERYLSPVLFAGVVATYFQSNDEAEAHSQLTRRELEVLQLVAEGLKSAEIAAQLSISPRTVETHRANIMRKLNVHSQASLIRYALEHRLTARD